MKKDQKKVSPDSNATLVNWENMIPSPQAMKALHSSMVWDTDTNLVLTKTKRQKTALVEMVAVGGFIEMGRIPYNCKDAYKRVAAPLPLEIAAKIKGLYGDDSPKLEPERKTPKFGQTHTDLMIRLLVDMIKAKNPFDNN